MNPKVGAALAGGVGSNEAGTATRLVAITADVSTHARSPHRGVRIEPLPSLDVMPPPQRRCGGIYGRALRSTRETDGTPTFFAWRLNVQTQPVPLMTWEAVADEFGPSQLVPILAATSNQYVAFDSVALVHEVPTTPVAVTLKPLDDDVVDLETE